MKVTEKYTYLSELFADILTGVKDIIQKAKLSKKFEGITITDEEREVLSRAKEICELEINNEWDEKDSKEFQALCSTYFDIATSLQKINENNLSDEDIFELLKIIVFGYLGEQPHFVKTYLKENSILEKLKIPEKWNERLLYSIFKGISLLVIKENWKDVENVIETINSLRKEQNEYENKYLNKLKEESSPYGSAELVALYHLAKMVEILGRYIIECTPNEPENQIEYHTRIALEFSELSQNISLFLLLKYFKEFAVKLIRNTIWYNLRGVNHFISDFNKVLTNRDKNNVFELLYPQKNSILNGELLNPAYRSIVLSLPTSSGKTLIAEYKILQALNVFKQNGGWVAYLVPTRTLINQVYARLKQDFESLKIKVERASGALEIDGFELSLIEDLGNKTDFDILVTTYEKMNLLVRQGLGTTEQRPLVLVVVDEAHNLADKSRGLNLEMLLSTIKNDCKEVNFLLLAPDIPNAKEVAEWLGKERSKTINLELDWWQPNERVIGAVCASGKRKNLNLHLKVLNSVKGSFDIDENIPIVNLTDEIKKSDLNSKIKISQVLASKIIHNDYPFIVLAAKVDDTYKIADYIYERQTFVNEHDEEINLVKKFVKVELGDTHPLVKYLDKRIAIHNSAIPDDIRLLIELLMEKGKLRVLVATTTIAQGINFPVSAVIMGSYNYPFEGPMPARDFWNLAGRVGRVGQKSLGWVGIACRNDDDLRNTSSYVMRASEDLLSQLQDIIQSLEQEQDFESILYKDERWSAILQYISHLRRQITDLNTFISQLEQKLQDTLGYKQLQEEKKRFLFNKLREYASYLSLDDAKRADSTGFSTISVSQMIGKLSGLNLSLSNWKKEQLFSETNETMQKLVGIMLKTYEIRKSLNEITDERVFDQKSISRLIVYWVNGHTISDIANRLNISIDKVSKALYKIITNSVTWGISALQKMPTSGVDWNYLNETEKKKILNIPAYIYYGVNTDEAVLMRKANVPRSIASNLGLLYKQEKGEDFINHSPEIVKSWINEEKIREALPAGSPLNEKEYFDLWKKLNFEE